MDIVYFGEPGSFSHLAAQRRFSKAALRSCSTVEQCFSQLFSGKATHAVVPMANASAGIITSTVDQLIALAQLKGQLLAVRESLVMKVELALLAKSSRSPIKKIYSHLAPFNHARLWLKKHYPFARQIIVVSTSAAAQQAAKEKGAAALGGLHTAKMYKLKVVRRGVGADIPNQTTFLVVGQPLIKTYSPDLVAIVFETAHKPGALLAVLKALADNKINLTKIESRPIPGRFSEFIFMVEFEAKFGSKACKKALKRIEQVTKRVAVVGAYPTVKV